MLNTALWGAIPCRRNFVADFLAQHGKGRQMSEEHRIAEVEIAADKAIVWRALREPGQLRNWFGWDAPTLDEEIRMIFLDAEADEAAGIVQFGEWQGVSDRFELSAHGSGTLVRVVRRGPVPEGGWDAAYDEVIEGWTTFIAQLRFYLERHRGDSRRTLYFSSKAGPGVIEATGLIGVGEAGSHFARELSPGDAVSGEVWHWSRHQLAVTVEEWSGGLIVVGDRPHGGGSALLTTYGLSDAEFAALETRWRTWWNTAYPQSPGK